VNPFGGAYLEDQILQMGPGSRLTVEMQHPVFEDSSHSFGVDFLVFGNAFFQLNGDWTTTSGFLAGTNRGLSRVSVSADGGTFYRLDPARAPVVDIWFPTDGEGDFGLPVDPALGAEDFAGLGLPGVRELYGGSGGGTGYDLAWAVDEQGRGVELPWVRFVRLEQLEGTGEVDAISGVMPRRALVEDFSGAPAGRGWAVHGEAALFVWDPAAEALDVTWDSSRPNSYFHHALGTILSRADDFVLSFDLRLSSIMPGATEGKPAAFQIAAGLVDLASAVRPGLLRGTGVDSEAGARNVLEFDYFPDGGFGATLSPVIVSSNNQFAAEFAFPVELPLERWVTVVLDYSGSEGVLRSRVLSEGQVLHTIAPVALAPQFSDFRFNTVAICSYSDAGQNPAYPQGSVLAHGTVDNLVVLLPDPAVLDVTGEWGGGGWSVTLQAQPAWEYELERTTDFTGWTLVDRQSSASSGQVTLLDPAPAAEHGFYRVRAVKP
jgi:hypothetical protein